MGVGRVFGAALGHGGAGYDYPVTKLTIMPCDRSAVLKWTDPCDDEWLGTKIVRKIGAYPESVTDGVLVADSKIRNQYDENGFVDTGLVNGTEYYYKAFPYSSKGVNTSYLNRLLPITPFMGEILTYTGSFEDRRVTVNGEERRLVTLKTSGILTVSGIQLAADIWMCGGGAAGNFRGGGGGYTATVSGSRLSGSYTITVGAGGAGTAASGGTTSGFGLTAAGGNGSMGAGGSGGGSGGPGSGISTVPFGLTSLFSPHCAGGGGGASVYSSNNGSSETHGGAGGSNGSNGQESTTYSYNGNDFGGFAWGGYGGALGGGGGGAASCNENGRIGYNGGAASYYGSGGGGYGSYTYSASKGSSSGTGTGGPGYQGVVHLLITE